MRLRHPRATPIAPARVVDHSAFGGTRRNAMREGDRGVEGEDADRECGQHRRRTCSMDGLRGFHVTSNRQRPAQLDLRLWPYGVGGGGLSLRLSVTLHGSGLRVVHGPPTALIVPSIVFELSTVPVSLTVSLNGFAGLPRSCWVEWIRFTENP